MSPDDFSGTLQPLRHSGLLASAIILFLVKTAVLQTTCQVNIVLSCPKGIRTVQDVQTRIRDEFPAYAGWCVDNHVFFAFV